MENKINIARFKEVSRTAEVKGIWQWDYGQILRIQGLNLPAAVEIHFSLDEHGGEAARRIGVAKDGVTDVVIPDSMVENESAYGDSYYFFAYIYLTDETSGNTEYKIRAKVSTRSKPEGYVSGGNDTFAEILKTVNEIAEDKVDIPAPAKVGQVLSVKATDESGKPTEFEAKDMSGGVSDEKIAEAVGAYMEANPIEETDPTVPDWAKKPEKPSYTADEVGALPNTTTTLPNPNALTFTGAVTGSYDGSSPIEINIPEGGGTGVTVDTTLSVAGQAADAKATGDAISSLSEEIANLGNGTYSSIEPADDDIPKVFINGNIPTTKDDVLAELEYVSKTRQFKAYLEIKCQGDSSMAYQKKNFTIKMFSDEARTIKLKKEFKGWGEHNKFVLKANWIDHSHARNIVSAKLWGQIVASRSDYNSLPTGLKTSPNNGAIEGFPVKVYNNGTYQGIYTWNIPKDDWLYGVDEYDANQFVLYGQHNTNGVYAETATNFRKLWDGVSQSDREWEVEVGTNSDIVKTALNNVISLCMNADDVTFKNTLNNYLDIQSALDYYIFCYTICALDSLAQNMILVSYDGAKLYCSAYDLDSTFGLWWNGQSFVSTSYRCPEDYQEPYSLLWERIEKLYAEELKARHLELRNSVLSFHNMCTHFERFMDVIGLDLYAEDLTIYTGIPSGSTNNIKQIRNYIRDRLTYVDGEFENIGEEEPDTPDIPGDVTLSSISATYSGGEVAVGTALTSLTGIAVTAHYSDGSTSNVTDYTLSGTIVEGENTITVSYGGKTTTFTVTGVVMVVDDGIDYTLDALSGVTWTDGQSYNKNTGEVESVNGEHCTSKFTVQDCLYLFTLGSGNTYGRLHAWDENDNYLWSYECNTNITYQLKPTYKYAVKVYNTGTFDSSLVSLIPVDHRATMEKRVAIDLSAITANEIGSNGSGYTFRYEINITDKVDGLITAKNSVCNIDAVNRFSSHMIWHDSFSNAFPNIPTSATEPFIKLSAFQTYVLLCFYTDNTTITTVEEMVAYLQENNFNFILNDDPVIS